MNEDQQQEPVQNQNTQTPQITTSHETIPVPSYPNNKIANRKRNIVLIIILLVVLLIGSAVAYVLLIYIPNKPENVFKKALSNYASGLGNYSINAQIDQPGPNDPDYNISMLKNGDSSSAEIAASTFLQNPSVAVRKIDDKTYVKLSGFEDSKKLATHYTNLGEKGIQEYIAQFTEAANITPSLEKWLEVGTYVFDQPKPEEAKAASTDSNNIQLTTIGATEVADGKTLRKYEATLTKDGFEELISRAQNQLPVLTSVIPKGGITASEFKVNIWVDTKSKTISKVDYSGRPFKEATLNFTMKSEDSPTIDTPKSVKLTDVIGYGIVRTEIFNKAYQSGSNDNDKERIADMKGMKTALEIYKSRNGHYPERYEMSVDQASFIASNMPGADIEIFTDPGGRLIGLNGSQYAYVGTLKDNSETCDRFSKPCEKFFIITTLDDGSNYQLNSD